MIITTDHTYPIFGKCSYFQDLSNSINFISFCGENNLSMGANIQKIIPIYNKKIPNHRG